MLKFSSHSVISDVRTGSTRAAFLEDKQNASPVTSVEEMNFLRYITEELSGFVTAVPSRTTKMCKILRPKSVLLKFADFTVVCLYTRLLRHTVTQVINTL